MIITVTLASQQISEHANDARHYVLFDEVKFIDQDLHGTDVG